MAEAAPILFLLGIALLIFYARARAVVRAEIEDPDDERLKEYVYFKADSAEERAQLRRELRARGFSKQQIEGWMRNSRQIQHVQHLRALHGRDPFPSRALAKKD